MKYRYKIEARYFWLYWNDSYNIYQASLQLCVFVYDNSLIEIMMQIKRIDIFAIKASETVFGRINVTRLTEMTREVKCQIYILYYIVQLVI